MLKKREDSSTPPSGEGAKDRSSVSIVPYSEAVGERTSKGADAPKVDWAAKDRRISKSGLLQAAFQSVVQFSATSDDLYSNALALAKRGYKEIWGEEWGA